MALWALCLGVNPESPILLNSGPRPPQKNPTAQHVYDEDDTGDEDKGDDDADIDGGDDNNGDADHDDDDDGDDDDDDEDDDDDDDDDNNDDASSNVDAPGIWKRLLRRGLLHNIFSSHKPEQICSNLGNHRPRQRFRLLS